MPAADPLTELLRHLHPEAERRLDRAPARGRARRSPPNLAWLSEDGDERPVVLVIERFGELFERERPEPDPAVRRGLARAGPGSRCAPRHHPGNAARQSELDLGDGRIREARSAQPGADVVHQPRAAADGRGAGQASRAEVRRRGRGPSLCSTSREIPPSCRCSSSTCCCSGTTGRAIGSPTRSTTRSAAAAWRWPARRNGSMPPSTRRQQEAVKLRVPEAGPRRGRVASHLSARAAGPAHLPGHLAGCHEFGAGSVDRWPDPGVEEGTLAPASPA